MIRLFVFLCLCVTAFGQPLTIGDPALHVFIQNSGPDLITNLFYDTFDDGAGPLSSTRNAYPGPGVWTNTQNNGSALWVTNAYDVGYTQAVFGALGWSIQQSNNAFGNTRMIGDTFTNSPGLTFLSKFWVNGPALATQQCIMGFERSPITGNMDGASAYLNGVALGGYGNGTLNPNLHNYDHYVDFEVAVIIRPVGVYYLVRGGLRDWYTGYIVHYDDWQIYAISAKTASTNLYPVIDINGDAGWIDSFRIFQMRSEWTNQYYLASAAITGAVAQYTQTNMPLDAVIEYTFKAGNPNIETNIVFFRMKDTNNGYVITSQTNRVKLYGITNGVKTDAKVTATATIVSNSLYRMCVFSCFSNLNFTIDGFITAWLPGYMKADNDSSYTNCWPGMEGGSNFIVYPLHVTLPSYTGIEATKGVWSFGDSKILGNHDTALPQTAVTTLPNFQYYLCQMLNSNNNSLTYIEAPPRGGHSGYTVSNLASIIDNDLSQSFRQTITPKYALINMGVNDCNGNADSAWSSNFQYCVDAIHTKWPSTAVYITKIWTTNTCSQYSNITNYIAQIISARSGWCFSGVDESTFLTGTNTDDGNHLTHWGCVRAAQEWKAILSP